MRRHLPLAALTAGALGLTLTVVGGVPAEAAATVSDITDSSPEALVEALVGDGTPVSDVRLTGSPLAAGTFSGFDQVGFPDGVALSTGYIETKDGVQSSLLGPNDSEGNTGILGGDGDADLDAIVAPLTTGDAAVLEFDFVPTGSSITFSYIFGSEEYVEYVDSTFNDVFAFFVNGVNYATFDGEDGPDQPVTINTINQNRNTHLFVDNTDGHLDIQLDGLTTVLSFEAPVNAGQVNHIKLAIADTSDSILDSAVLLKAGTFRANTPPTATDIDGVTVRSGGSVDIPLEGSDADGDTLTYQVVTPPPADQGTVTISPDGTATFTPADGHTGTVTFTYSANDGSVDSSPATVTVTVTENQPPVTEDITGWEVAQGDTISFPLKGSDPDGDTLTYQVVTPPPADQGTVTISPDGTATFTPADGYTGAVAFTYSASDGSAQSVPSTVSGSVTDAPTVVPLPETPGTSDDHAVEGDAAWIVPEDSDTLTWELREDGHLLVGTKPGYVFPDVETVHDFGVAPDVYIAAPVPQPSAPGATTAPGTGGPTGAATSPGGSQLAVTGAPLSLVGVSALALLVAGGATLLLRRNRNS